MSHQVFSAADPSKSDLPLEGKSGGATKDNRPTTKLLDESLAAIGVHPSVIQSGLGGVVWFLAVIWLYFAWGARVDLDLAVAAGFFVMFFTLFLLLASRWLHERGMRIDHFLSPSIAFFLAVGGPKCGWDPAVTATPVGPNSERLSALRRS